MLLGARWAGPSAYYIKHYIYYTINDIVLFILSAMFVHACVHIAFIFVGAVWGKFHPPNTNAQTTANKQEAESQTMRIIMQKCLLNEVTCHSEEVISYRSKAADMSQARDIRHIPWLHAVHSRPELF